MMESRAEVAGFQGILVAGAIFLISCFMVYDEFDYWLNGAEADAHVTKCYETTGRRGSVSTTLEYSFTEANGTARKGMSTLEQGWRPPGSGIVRVKYTPGQDGRSRLVGRPPRLAFYIFGGSLLAIGGFAIFIWIDALRATAPEKKRNRRRLRM